MTLNFWTNVSIVSIMKLTDDLFMILIHHKNIQTGDIIYYVTSGDGSYVIHKSRIVKRTFEKHGGLRSFFDTFSYHCEDGYKFDSLGLTQPIFETMTSVPGSRSSKPKKYSPS